MYVFNSNLTSQVALILLAFSQEIVNGIDFYLTDC